MRALQPRRELRRSGWHVSRRTSTARYEPAADPVAPHTKRPRAVLPTCCQAGGQYVSPARTTQSTWFEC
jgi:hypothetical protein